MKRRPFIAGNWKMYKTIDEALVLVSHLKEAFLEEKNVDVVVAPPFTALKVVSDQIKDSVIQLSAQDTFWEESGAYTGEISPAMLRDVGCRYVIVGHSERRRYFREDNEMINRKIKATLNFSLVPIVCIGESLEEREMGHTFNVIERQINECLYNLLPDEVKSLIIAYEPIWAIGTGQTATDLQAQEAHQFIRQLLSSLYDTHLANVVRIIYGGSVKPDNIGGLMAQPDIDGALVGGASLNAPSFIDIVRFERG
ncbi:MAG TPA: triose-phosphate isomerase [Syntrophaceae bacterium]|nr:triose-phosphate isomerase [Syntrophaceae bacterium]